MTATKHLTQKELADRLGLTARQVHNLTEQGMPRVTKAGKAAYPWPEAMRWYIAQKVEAEVRKQQPSDLEAVKLAKLQAETKLAQIEAARAEGEVVPLEVHEAQLGAILDRLRAKMLAIPGKWAPALVGCRTIADALARLEPAVAEAMQTLADTGDELEADAELEDAA